jgi:hypothetical protein
MAELTGQVYQILSAGYITRPEGNMMWASKEYENGAKIISVINQTAEEVYIEAGRIRLEGYVSVGDGFGVDLEGRFFCNSGTFAGYLKTPLKATDYSDAENIYDSWSTSRYNIRNDLHIMSCSGLKTTDGYDETLYLPSDPSMEGARITILNASFPPYTRTPGSARYTTVIPRDGSRIRGLTMDSDITTWGDPLRLTFINGFVELIAIPTLTYNDDTYAIEKSGIQWAVVSMNVGYYELNRTYY